MLCVSLPVMEEQYIPCLRPVSAWSNVHNVLITFLVYFSIHTSAVKYGTSHIQCCTHRQVPASARLKWVSYRKTLLVCVLTRACVLLSFVCALVRRVLKNLLEHHKSFTMAILYDGPATINLVDMIRILPIYQIRIVMRFYG